MNLHKVPKQDFDTVLFQVHKDVFDDEVEESFFRYTYALFTEKDGEPVSYILVNERNAECAEMAYGGTVKEMRGVSSKESLMMFLNELHKDYKYVVYQTKNTNFPMLRLGLALGGKIIGVHQNPRNNVYVTVEFSREEK